jgi:hypothetical protein
MHRAAEELNFCFLKQFKSQTNFHTQQKHWNHLPVAKDSALETLDFIL